MKHQGQALNLVVIGLGQGGGNIAAEFFRRGYETLALNTAQTDLNALSGRGNSLPPERRLYIGLDGYDGAGSDPEYGSQCIASNARAIQKRVSQYTEEADAILVTAGLGGGTGSAVAELVAILEHLEVPIMALVTLPNESESGVTKVNAVRAVNRLVKVPLSAWIIVDNAQLSKLHHEVPAAEYHAHINQLIAEPLDSLNRYNDREELTAIRAFDGEDLRKVLLNGGVLHYGLYEIESLKAEVILEKIDHSMEHSELMPGGFDASKVSHLAAIVEAPQSVLSKTPMAVFDEVHEKLKKKTEGAIVDVGIYRSQERESAIRLCLLAASRALPIKVQDLVSDAKTEGKAIRTKLDRKVEELDLGEIDDFDLLNSGPRAGALYASSNEVEERTPTNVSKAPKNPAVNRLGYNSPSGYPSDEQADSIRIGYNPSGIPPTVKKASSSTLPPPLPSSKNIPTSATISNNSSLASTDSAAKVFTNQEKPSLKNSSNQESNATFKGAETKRTKIPKTKSKSSSQEDLPSAEFYEELVKKFHAAKDEKSKKKIAAQLESDLKSQHPVVRFYAVDAMAKIDRDRFSSLLRIAADDENTAVRKIAHAAVSN